MQVLVFSMRIITITSDISSQPTGKGEKGRNVSKHVYYNRINFQIFHVSVSSSQKDDVVCLTDVVFYYVVLEQKYFCYCTRRHWRTMHCSLHLRNYIPVYRKVYRGLQISYFCVFSNTVLMLQTYLTGPFIAIN